MKKLLSLVGLAVFVTSVGPINNLNDSNQKHVIQNSTLSSGNNDEYILQNQFNKNFKYATKVVVSSGGAVYVLGGDENNTQVYKSTDGKNFTKMSEIPGRVWYLSVSSQGIVYAATLGVGSLYKSTDGENFIETSIKNMNITSLFIDKDDNIYFGAGGIDGGIYTSSDGRDFIKIYESERSIISLAVDEQGTVYGGIQNDNEGDIVRGTYGQNFKKIKIPGASIVQNIFISSKGSIFINSQTNSSTLFKSNDGQNFKEIKSLSLVGAIENLIRDSKGKIYLGSSFGFFSSINNGETFEKIQGFSGIKNLTIDSDDNIILIESHQAGNQIFKIKNSLTWAIQQFQFILIDPTKNINWISSENLISSGKLNVHVQNNNIQTIQLNGQTLPQTNKVWDFEIGEEGKNTDYTVNVNFTINNEVYNVEMIISILMDAPKITIKTNQGELINQYSTILPGAEKINNISTSNPIYYSKTEALISLLKPTWASSLTGIIYGLNADWQKNGQTKAIAENDTVNIDGSQLGAYNGRYLVETTDDAGNKESYYAVVIDDETQKPVNFWDTEDGQYFFEYAIINGFDGNKIKAFNSKEINDLISQSLEWENDLANDSQILEALVSTISENLNIGTSSFISHDEVIGKLKALVPDKLEISGFFTNLYNAENVSITLESSNEGFAIGDTVSFKISYQGENSDSISFTINEVTEPTSNWVKIIFVVGAAAVIALAGLLGYKFVSKKIRLKKEAEHVARETTKNKTEENNI